MSETTAHISLFQFLQIASTKLPALAYVWHTKNENADEAERKRGGQLGVVPGVWDVLYIGQNQEPVHGYGRYHFRGLAIELKSSKAYRKAHNGLSPEQLRWQMHYCKSYWYTVVYPEQHWHEAAHLLVAWVGGNVEDFQF